jgi:hypothetical protein
MRRRLKLQTRSSPHRWNRTLRYTSVMKPMVLAGCLAFGFLSSARAQQTTANNQKFLDTARSRYYDLQARGLVSFRCGVHFEWSTSIQKRAGLSRSKALLRL